MRYLEKVCRKLFFAIALLMAPFGILVLGIAFGVIITLIGLRAGLGPASVGAGLIAVLGVYIYILVMLVKGEMRYLKMALFGIPVLGLAVMVIISRIGLRAGLGPEVSVWAGLIAGVGVCAGVYLLVRGEMRYLKMRYLKVYLRIIPVTAVSCVIGGGLALAVFIIGERVLAVEQLVPPGGELLLSSALFVSVVVAGSCIMGGPKHIRAVEQLPYGKSEGALGVYHVRNVELPLPYDKAFNSCLESLRSFKRYKIKKEDHSQGKIVAKAQRIKPKWEMGKSRISFEVRKIDDNRTQIVVSSRPASGILAFVDYGANLMNVEEIRTFLRERGEASGSGG